MINFYLPDFYYYYNLNMVLINILKKNPDYFYDNIKIAAIYGSFPGQIWNGGRLVSGFSYSDNIEATINNYNDLNIPIRLTYTNPLLDETHLNDTYCNFITKIANNGMNEIVVNS
ncbi:MAG: hypothetical protein E7270_01110 [Lachnospiraceae bacterium]|nr:hypothetical protein [Lachnospiraceae bacterium]